MNGIDISQWQGDMDLTPYKDGFVIVRGGFWTSADPWGGAEHRKVREARHSVGALLVFLTRSTRRRHGGGGGLVCAS